ncbi:hypothetical protein BG006_003628 [Podila minutissima]|uniref:Uncharacterized protein n=1 Tax=Podila minutissima TaxID=64525 RepID=A0A9P5SAP6_9FUNG|nr:hypothetical protein BG006_003628 [Podila minutissima]
MLLSVFSSVKTHVHQETVVADTLPGHVMSGLARITTAMARGWIHEVGRNFQLSLTGTPLGHLYDVHQALPEGYHDPYIEGWDGESEHEEDKEEEVDVDDDKEVSVNEDKEESGDKGEGDEVEEGEEEEEVENEEEEDGTQDEVHLHAHNKYLPLHT